MAQNSKLGDGNKWADVDNKSNKNLKLISTEPSPKDRYARSMDAVQRLDVSGSERISNSQ
jgi:hypothetical protein